jgi:hypothetical protein
MPITTETEPIRGGKRADQPRNQTETRSPQDRGRPTLAIRGHQPENMVPIEGQEMTDFECPVCGCISEIQSSDGGVESRHTRRIDERVSEATAIGFLQPNTLHREGGSPAGEVSKRATIVGRSTKSSAGVAPGPSDTKLGPARATTGVDITRSSGGQFPGGPPVKRGRPRIGEVREKPWLTCDPPMSRATYHRRQAEQREKKNG